jgi:transcriptional regulator with XRE-family HTH domain
LRDVLAGNMRRLRAARGLTQEALAHESGINRTYLSGVERSERNVSLDNIARIARGELSPNFGDGRAGQAAAVVG